MEKGKKVLAVVLFAAASAGALLALGGCSTGSPEEIDKILKETRQWEQELKQQKERQEEQKRRGL